MSYDYDDPPDPDPQYDEWKEGDAAEISRLVSRLEQRCASLEADAARMREKIAQLVVLLSSVRGEIIHRPTCAIDMVPAIDRALAATIAAQGTPP